MLVEVGVEVPGDPVGGEVGDGAEVLPVGGVLAVALEPHALVLTTHQPLHRDRIGTHLPARAFQH